MVIIKRKIKLLIFFLVFILVAPIVVFYANGDILGNGWSLLPTGGIYVTKAPIGSLVFLNGKLKDTTSFFSRSFLIRSLEPGNYEVSVKKSGYNVWTEKISVANNLVADADAFILPSVIATSSIPKYSETQKRVGTSTITVEKKNQAYEDISLLFATATPSLFRAIPSTSSIDFADNLGTAESPVMADKLGLWQDKGKIYAAWFGDEDDSPEYLCNQSDCSEPLLVYNLGSTATRIDFLPGYSDVAVVASGNSIFAIQMENYSNKVPQIIYQGLHPDFRIDDGNLYVKDNGNLLQILL